MSQENNINQNINLSEKIKNFFFDNKKIIIIIFSLIVFLLILFFGYKEIQKRKILKLSEDYNSAISFFENGNNSKSKDLLKTIIEKKNKTYSVLAFYFLLDNDLVQSKNEINKYFDLIIDKLNLEKEIKFLNIYKKALYNSEFADENQMIQMLKPVINSESVWKSHSLYLLAEYFYAKNEKQKSKGFFEKILDMKDANKKIFNEAQNRLSRNF